MSVGIEVTELDRELLTFRLQYLLLSQAKLHTGDGLKGE